MFKNVTAALFIIFALISGTSLAGSPTAYVINTSSETMDKIDLATHSVTHAVTTQGSDIDCYPNQILVRNGMAYVINSGTDESQLIDLSTSATAGWINLPGGSNPYWMDFVNDSILYVSLMVTNSLARVNVAVGTIFKTNQGQVECRIGVTGVGSLTPPEYRFPNHLRDAFPSKVQPAKIVLGIGVALVGGEV